MSDERFSIMNLEKDVLEYHNYKKKYNEYYEKHKDADFSTKDNLKIKRDYWYKLYINKMRYLERNYRKTNIYTDYHKKLERQQRRNTFDSPVSPSAPHLIERPSSPISIPTAIPLSRSQTIRNHSPITIPAEQCRPL